MPSKTLVAPSTTRHPFLLSVEDVARQLDTNVEHGLSARQVAELKSRCPSNELEDGEGVAWYTILIKQVSNALILVSSLRPPSLPSPLKMQYREIYRFSFLRWR